MNPVIETIMNHRSIRQFKNEKLTKDQINTIIQAAQMASTSRFMQSYSIIGITDPILKRELGALTGLSCVAENGHFLIFCADLSRVTMMASEVEQANMEQMLESTQFYQISIVDAALAAQNAALAAESMGLGIVYIGAIARKINEIDTLLNLPSYVIPLFGIAIGIPDQQPEIKPRLPMEAVYFENGYNADTDTQRERIASYDKKMHDYYQTRSENNRLETWSGKNIALFQSKLPTERMSEYIKGKKLNRK